jgi:hypothetical protein
VVQVFAEGFPNQTERISVASCKVSYPQLIRSDEPTKTFTFDLNQSSRKWIQIENFAGNVYDISDPFAPVRLVINQTNVLLKAGRSRLVAVNEPSQVGSIQSVQLTPLDVSGRDYLIIYDDSLTRQGNPIAQYANYRSSVQGGGFNVLSSEINNIYNLYNYGHPSVLAITNLIRDVYENGALKHVFIIGKGYTVNAFRTKTEEVNIPTFGFPGGDLMYGVGITGDDLAPAIPVGRLNARSPGEVIAYLNKVIEHEERPFVDLTRKDFLQLSGGRNGSELESFERYISEFEDIFVQDFIGGKAFNTGKRTSDVVEFIPIAEQVNEGVGYITFFGHSSGNATDIEIGRVSDPSFGFSNNNKYPIFLVNGCQAGEIFGNSVTFGEDWMLTPNLGAISFLAHTNVAYSDNLRSWSTLYYEIGFASESISKSIGEILIEISEQYLQNNGTGGSNLAQVRQMQLQGDPAVRLFGADHPDYALEDNAISATGIDSNVILASQDSFKVEVIVKNFGRSILDSLRVSFNRTLPDGSQLRDTEKFERVLRQDTLVTFLQLRPQDQNVGINLISVTLDPLNEQEELDKLNNTGQTEVTIFQGNTINLFPINHAIVSGQEVTLQWQSSNNLENERLYDLEIDTQSDFLGPDLQRLSLSGEVLLSHIVDLSAYEDGTTFFWRTRFSDAEDSNANLWVTSSFTYLPGNSGWGQFDKEVILSESVTSGLQLSEAGNLEFESSTTPIEFFTFGINAGLGYNDLRAIVDGTNFLVTGSIDPFCDSNSLNVMVFDKNSGDPKKPLLPDSEDPADVRNPEVCGLLPQRIFNFNQERLENNRLQVLVDEIEVGDMIVIFTIDSVAFSQFSSNVLTTLNSLGIANSSIQALEDGQPLIIFGRKGDDPGTALVLDNNGSVTPVKEQQLLFNFDVEAKFSSGRIQSSRIGPVRQWGQLAVDISQEANDQIQFNIFGFDRDGNTNLISEEQLDASRFPQIAFELLVSDSIDQTPAQLNHWQIDFVPAPEGLTLPAGKELVTIQEGQDIGKKLTFYNFSTEDFTDSLTIEANLIDQNGNSTINGFKVAPPVSNDTTRFDVSFPSRGKVGKSSLIVNIIPNENEAYAINNRVTLTNFIEVAEDEINPALDVTFDGFRILNGDIVSPSPLIAILVKDENDFLFKTDTTGINIRLKKGEGAYERINFSNPNISYTVANEEQDFEIEYQPDPLDDGVYTLEVQAQDETGNQSGTVPYEVSFEVINESTITHFYPYPNPFSTSCRFVFTLTGSTIPDQMKIQIMTVSGRVVREITQDEIGPIRIGNNITSYAWDGRDEFGDQLANGVYFYRVFVRSSGNDLNRRNTSADRAFKKGFGKLYILR